MAVYFCINVRTDSWAVEFTFEGKLMRMEFSYEGAAKEYAAQLNG